MKLECFHCENKIPKKAIKFEIKKQDSENWLYDSLVISYYCRRCDDEYYFVIGSEDFFDSEEYIKAYCD